MMRTLTVWRLVVAGMLLTMALDAGAAEAQSVSAAWPGLKPSRLQTIYVRDVNGDEVKGTLLGLNADSLTLLVGDHEQTMDRTSIARIQRRDSLKNGAIAGALVGVLFGAVAAGISDCPDDSRGGSCAGFRAVLFPLGVAVYSGIGVAIDAAIPGRSTIYEASSPRVHLSGPQERGGLAVRASLSW